MENHAIAFRTWPTIAEKFNDVLREFGLPLIEGPAGIPRQLCESLRLLADNGIPIPYEPDIANFPLNVQTAERFIVGT